jgi:hypothetical protein
MKKKSVEVKIKFDNKKLAKHFVDWLDNQGEQDFMNIDDLVWKEHGLKEKVIKFTYKGLSVYTYSEKLN